MDGLRWTPVVGGVEHLVDADGKVKAWARERSSGNWACRAGSGEIQENFQSLCMAKKAAVQIVANGRLASGKGRERSDALRMLKVGEQYVERASDSASALQSFRTAVSTFATKHGKRFKTWQREDGTFVAMRLKIREVKHDTI
jgi:hypothetical protein